MKKYISATLAVVSIIWTQSVWACLAVGPFSKSDKTNATIVFNGKVKAYEYLENEKIAKITFEVVKPIKGKKMKYWEALYVGNTNNFPPATMAEFKKTFGKVSEVGLRMATSEEPYDSKTGMVNAPKSHSHIPVLVQGPCNPPYLLKAK